MEEAIITLLTSAAGVTALAGNRINWSLRPDADALPAVSLHRVSGERDASLAGRTGLVASTVQVDCWARTYGEAKRLARAVILALPHARNTVGGVVLQGIFIDRESDSFDGEEPHNVFRTRIDFSVWHSEPQGG